LIDAQGNRFGEMTRPRPNGERLMVTALGRATRRAATHRAWTARNSPGPRRCRCSKTAPRRSPARRSVAANWLQTTIPQSISPILRARNGSS
jgi:hypothetical protein